MTVTEIMMTALLILLAYVYAGYPLLLRLFSALFPRPHRYDPGHAPSVTLVISAYNEAEIIGSKIENSLALNYPRELLSILVVSDCSDDGTDDVVLSFADRGVGLVRAGTRKGKTAALNRALPGVESEIVVFSDANALYDKEAIRNLVRHFADPAIGYVVGHSRYREEVRTAAGSSEGAYWNLEVMMKEWESRFSSVVGGDGAIYAIRRELYRPMRETDINDFVNPLQIVALGYRGLFDSAAFCFEQPAGKFEKEFSRKVRIVNRSFNAFLRVPQACNPLRNRRFAWQLVSHKLLRWFSPFLVLLFLAALVLDIIADPASMTAQLLAAPAALFFLLAAIGRVLDGNEKPHPLFYLPYYFVLVIVASAYGILLRLKGTTIATWTTVRQAEEGEGEPEESRPAPRLIVPLLLSVLLLAAAAAIGGLGATACILTLILAHGAVFYPLLLVPMARLFGKAIAVDEGYRPEVTLVIVAYNEAAVIEAKLENTLALDYPKELLRVIVASDGSTDGTDAIVARYARRGIELANFPKNRGKIAALNDAMRCVTSEVVVFSDANVNYDPGAILKLVRNLADPRVGAVSGKVILSSRTVSYGVAERAYYSLEHAVQKNEGALGALIGGDGAMYAVRRSLFVPPDPDTILDDLVIPMSIARRGFLVLHEKEALGFEENLLEIRREFRRKARIIAGGYQCLLRAKVLPRLSQPLLLFCFVSHKVLRWGSGLLFLLLLGVLLQIELLYGDGSFPLFSALLLLIGSAGSLALLAQLFPCVQRVKAATICHYFFMLIAASLVGCYLGVTGKQKVTWREKVA